MRKRSAIVVVALTMILPSVCLPDTPTQQHPSSSSIAMFRKFFSQVAALPSPTEKIYLNGQPGNLRYPTLQETMGVSDREAELLKAVAVRCEEERKSIDNSDRALTLAARLDSIAGQSEDKRYAALQRKLDEVVVAAFETLEGQLGAARFGVVATFVSDEATQPRYFLLRER